MRKAVLCVNIEERKSKIEGAIIKSYFFNVILLAFHKKSWENKDVLSHHENDTSRAGNCMKWITIQREYPARCFRY